MSLKKTPGIQSEVKEKKEPSAWLSRILWLGAVVMTTIMVFSLIGHFSKQTAQAASPTDVPLVTPEAASLEGANVPELVTSSDVNSIERSVELDTNRDNAMRNGLVKYVVESGDSIFGIAKSYDVSPEALLWANYDVLNDDPHNIYIGTELVVPPANGIYYKWKQGDTLQAVSDKYRAEIEDVLTYPGNHLDASVSNPSIEPGTFVMIPGGWRETTPWVVPTIPRGRAGVTTSIPGACVTGEGGAYGTGSFIYPADNHTLSGNDYWSGHLALDFAAGTGATLYATDSGVIVYAGWNTSGYGNMVMIDHGNGYASLYAHLSSINVTCGQSVYQGNVIGYAGSTGNSTGPHLHFEIRYFSGFINPWSVLH